MERLSFLKSLMIGTISSPILINACNNPDTVTTGTKTTNNNNCGVIETETEGPFPNKIPASYVRSDITDGRSGYKMSINITVKNSNNSCSPLSNALVDIWHCDAEGFYSEYGGGFFHLQSADYTSVHFLRGRQTTNSNGLVSFNSIFPGWYGGRATHIHVHIYNSAGNSLKVTQIAFPEGAGSALAAVGGYKKGLSGYVFNADDFVFRSDKEGLEMTTVTGNTTDGFALSISMSVPA